MQHITEIFDEIISATTVPSNEGKKSKLHLIDLFKVACEQIEQLNVLDFPPDKRFEYTILRQRYRKLGRLGSYSGSDITNFVNLTRSIKSMMPSYGLIGSQINARDFSFVEDLELRRIIERDYAEFNNVLIPDGAWKSAVVLAGSILEAILFDILSSPTYHSNAMAAQKAPRRKGLVTDIVSGEWKLINLIDVSVEVGLIPETRAAAIDQILRDYRNFIHPKKEVRAQHSCTEAESFLAKGALDSVLNHLEANL
ncbi:hypothetical protein [Burkholderia cepacia]|uniref:hypothetical protein n=1 Tax=Burkholderia cepacia TaxID=292 RepID=UPI001588A1BB|nr:hypothetical protein [Burkholderia cepacia]